MMERRINGVQAIGPVDDDRRDAFGDFNLEKFVRGIVIGALSPLEAGEENFFLFGLTAEQRVNRSGSAKSAAISECASRPMRRSS